MGLFNKIKNMFKKDSVDEKKEDTIVEEVEDDGLNPLAIDQEEPIEEAPKVEKKKEKAKDSVKVYEKGLTKSRQGFVSKLANLTNKYNKVTYFSVQ